MSDELMHADWNWEKEDYSFLESLPEAPMKSSAWEAFSRPEEVLVDWHRTENQGSIGSCQGHSLSSVLERLAFVRGEKIQLSEIFAYLASQKIDGLLGSDTGSTISGGGRVAMEVGCCPETLTGYPRSYPSRQEQTKILSSANYEAAKPYKALSLWKVPRNHEETLNFIGGGGGINFGILWYDGLIPRDRIVRRYAPPGRGGGHAMAVLGYTKDQMYRAVNSWADGEYLIAPEAWDQMLRHQWTAAIGLMGNKEAQPVDWYKNSPYYKLQERPHDHT